MADKKITDLQLIAAVTDSISVPGDDGIQTYRFTPLQLFSYLRPKIQGQQNEVSNLTITTAVASSALTVALKTLAGVDASSTDKIRVAFRSATLVTGSYVLREISSALSVVVSSGSTLGQINGQPAKVYVYLIDNAGTPELAVSHQLFPEDALVSTTAEGGSGAADSASVMYSTAARTNVACRLIGYVLNTQTTAGTWASAGTQIQLLPAKPKGGYTFQVLTTTGSQTYLTPPGCLEILVIAIGAGGGSGGCAASGSNMGAAGGGGAGATVIKSFPNPLPSYSAVVGAGGTAASAGQNSGGTGAATTFSTMSANGGGGGNGSPSTTGPVVAAGGGIGGAAGSSGDINLDGGGGGNGKVYTSGQMESGFGGGSAFGASALSLVNTVSAGRAGAVYGGGAAGSSSTAGNGAQPGTIGAQGILIIFEIY